MPSSSRDSEIPFLIRDHDYHEDYCLFVKRPSVSESPLHYVVSFSCKDGRIVYHRVRITHDMPYFEMTVRGRFVITSSGDAVVNRS